VAAAANANAPYQHQHNSVGAQWRKTRKAALNVNGSLRNGVSDAHGATSTSASNIDAGVASAWP